jgi:hypothetical protein
MQSSKYDKNKDNQQKIRIDIILKYRWWLIDKSHIFQAI